MHCIYLFLYVSDVDMCETHPNLCGMEAGCYPQGNSYVCLCTDLEPAGPNNSCDRNSSKSK